MKAKSKLLELTEGLQVPDNLPPAAPPPSVAAAEHQFPPARPAASPRTGPGQMIQLRGHMLANEEELERLRAQLADHDGALPTRKLDPRTVKPSKWANRHADSFKSADFERLKEDIASAGGNVQPIWVRATDGGEYELVFGHRRHRACLELSLPVLATIAPVSDLDLFATMDRENRERADLSPYEQGLMYRRALDQDLYSSNRKLAEALGISHTWVNRVLAVADLPSSIVECFRSPLEIQHPHAKAVETALEQDRKAVLRRAEKLRQSDVKLAPRAVVAALTKVDEAGKDTAQPIKRGATTIGTWRRDGAGRLHIQLSADAVPEDRLQDLIKAISSSLE